MCDCIVKTPAKPSVARIDFNTRPSVKNVWTTLVYLDVIVLAALLELLFLYNTCQNQFVPSVLNTKRLNLFFPGLRMNHVSMSVISAH